MEKLSKKRLLNQFKKEISHLLPMWTIRDTNLIEDNELRLKANINGNTYSFIVVPCIYPYPSFIEKTLKKPGLNKKNLLLLSDYFPSGTQDFLGKENINFIDLSGNRIIKRNLGKDKKYKNIFIEVTGKSNLYSSPQRSVDIFSKKSSRIVRALLETYPGTLKLIDLAEQVNVSPALVTKITRTLEEDGLISIEKRTGVNVIEPGLLLDEWSNQYSRKKNILVGKYYCSFGLNEDFVSKTWNLVKDNDVVLTGSAGSALIAPFAEVKMVEIYIKNLLPTFQELIPVERGENVRFYEPYDEGVFDFKQKNKKYEIVCNTQLYLDLMANPARGREQAQFLRERKMKF